MDIYMGGANVFWSHLDVPWIRNPAEIFWIGIRHDLQMIIARYVPAVLPQNFAKLIQKCVIYTCWECYCASGMYKGFTWM